MNPTKVAELEAEIRCACDGAGLVAADNHAFRCYRSQVIDTSAWIGLHALAKAQADLLLKETA